MTMKENCKPWADLQEKVTTLYKDASKHCKSFEGLLEYSQKAYSLLPKWR